MYVNVPWTDTNTTPNDAKLKWKSSSATVTIPTTTDTQIFSANASTDYTMTFHNVAWSGKFSDLISRPTDLSDFTNGPGYAKTTDVITGLKAGTNVTLSGVTPDGSGVYKGGVITINASGSGSGTVTSVGYSAGSGITISGTTSPITTTGNITITNSGVTSITAGAGVTVSGETGGVMVNAPVNITANTADTNTNATTGLYFLTPSITASSPTNNASTITAKYKALRAPSGSNITLT